MKLSEAILVGSTCVTAMPYSVLWDTSPSRGCAMGMAMYAVGFRDEMELKSRGGSKSMPPEWRWLKDKAENPQLCKCQDDSDARLQAHNHLGYITHLFNEHVYRGAMTLEQLVDYVRSIEPAEHEPDPRDEEGSDVRPELEVYKGR